MTLHDWAQVYFVGCFLGGSCSLFLIGFCLVDYLLDRTTKNARTFLKSLAVVVAVLLWPLALTCGAAWLLHNVVKDALGDG